MKLRGPDQSVELQGPPPLSYNPNHLKKHSGNPPQLIWPSISHPTQLTEQDRGGIPAMDHIAARHRFNQAAEKKSDQLLGCTAFWEAIRRVRLVFIFDPHLTTRIMRRLREDLRPDKVSNLEYLLIIAGPDQQNECRTMAREIQKAYATARRTTKIDYLGGMKSTGVPFPHDRFAVTDGEFWHFGGTVGGLENCLTAVSRGWKVKDIGVEAFLESAWNELNGIVKEDS